jgi:hypothetical protein
MRNGQIFDQILGRRPRLCAHPVQSGPRSTVTHGMTGAATALSFEGGRLLHVRLMSYLPFAHAARIAHYVDKCGDFAKVTNCASLDVAGWRRE